jgi:5'-nucleotidase
MNLFLAFLLLFYFISPSLVHIDASVVPTLASRQQTSRFRLVHTNDVHVHYDEFNRFFTDCTDADLNSSYGCYGGAPRLLTAISKLRLEANQSNIPFLVLDAGDQFQGTLFYTYWKQFGMNITATVMNSLGVDTFTLGNHEFDDGTAGLVPMLRLLEAKVLAANMKSTNAELERLVEPYAVIEKAGIKIGVVGVTTPSTPAISSPGPDVEFGEVTSSVQSAIDELKAQDIKW